MALSLMALSLSSTVKKTLVDFDDHARILGTFEACVLAFARGSGVNLELTGLTMEGDDLCASVLVPSPPLLTCDQRLRVHVTVHTVGEWSVDLQVDERDDETPELKYVFHAQYAQSLLTLCMRAFLDATVVLTW